MADGFVLDYNIHIGQSIPGESGALPTAVHK